MLITFGDIQRQLDVAGHSQFVQLNGVDDDWEAARHVATGAVSSMFDHWTILQFLNRTNGDFNQTLMEGAFDIVANQSYANHSFFIKGWPGPIIRQRDMYPPNIPTPTTPEEKASEAAKRFNNELALFLLHASEKDFWIYSWFWGWCVRSCVLAVLAVLACVLRLYFACYCICLARLAISISVSNSNSRE